MNDIQLHITIWMNPVAWWGWLVPAPKSGLWNILEFSKLILKSSVAWNQPWWECLYHWNWQTLQTEPFFLFLFFESQLTSTLLDGSYRCWAEVTRQKRGHAGSTYKERKSREPPTGTEVRVEVALRCGGSTRLVMLCDLILLVVIWACSACKIHLWWRIFHRHSLLTSPNTLAGRRERGTIWRKQGDLSLNL